MVAVSDGQEGGKEVAMNADLVCDKPFPSNPYRVN